VEAAAGGEPAGFEMSADPKALHPLVRPLNWGDLDRIMEIELAAYPVPWSRGIFGDCIRVGYDCWGLQIGQQLIGYSIQTDGAGEAHLLNLCVDPRWHGRGFGGMLLENAIRVARKHHCLSMFLEVRPSNAAGIALYRNRGFVTVGTRAGYYSTSAAGGAPASKHADAAREDALVMRLELSEG
jgi:ribosomal-protein-alanine N-acetyltransferase